MIPLTQMTRIVASESRRADSRHPRRCCIEPNSPSPLSRPFDLGGTFKHTSIYSINRMAVLAVLLLRSQICECHACRWASTAIEYRFIVGDIFAVATGSLSTEEGDAANTEKRNAAFRGLSPAGAALRFGAREG
jgi:hypothetical protein